MKLFIVTCKHLPATNYKPKRLSVKCKDLALRKIYSFIDPQAAVDRLIADLEKPSEFLRLKCLGQSSEGDTVSLVFKAELP